MSQEGLIRRLGQAANSGSLIVICGAGTSLSATSGDPRAGWSGFLEHALTWCQQSDVHFEGTNGLVRAHADLQAGDLVSAADKIQRALEKAGEWTRLLTETMGALRLADPSIAKLIRRLGSPIATTNYDTLLEEGLGLISVTWRSTTFGAALRGETRAVAHLHGVYTEPESVVLGSGSYGRIQASVSAQALEQAIALKNSLLFVGVGEGLKDPNLGELLRFLDRHFGDTGITHFWLATEEQAATSRPDSVLKPIVFGSDARTELVPYLRDLVERIRPEKKTIAVAQLKSDLLASPLLPAFDISGPALRDLWPDRLIDVRVRPLRGLSQKPLPFSEWIKSASLPGRLVVVGAAGAGKSTVLRTLTLDEHCVSLPAREFLHAQELAEADEIGVDSNAMLVVDALDELGELELEHCVALLAKEKRNFVWMSCRMDFLGKKSAAKDLLDRADQVLEVQPLEPREVDLFVESFLRSSGADNSTALRLSNWRESIAFDAMLSVPLNLTLALFLATGLGASDHNRVPPRNRYELYSRFYEHWLGYEASRLSLSEDECRLVRASHTKTATALYARRLDTTLPPFRGDQSEHGEVAEIVEMLLKRERRNPMIIRRFIHDTYMEYLLAEQLLDQLRGLSEVGIALDVAFNDDVNAFVRDGLSVLALEEREGALQRLEEVYAEAHGDREREHALYYIGRLDLPYCPAVLISAFRSERSPLSRRAAALGAILHGHNDVEEKYLTLVADSAQEDLLNRSVQLVYFGDGRGELHDFTDRGGAWIRTRKALFARLSRSDIRSTRLRWWDLQTAFSLFNDRAIGLSDTEQQLMREILKEHSEGSSARDLAIASLARRLMDL
jgi:hypothetical protein